MTDTDLRAAATAAGTTSAPKARAAAVDVFPAAPLGLVVGSNGSLPAEARSVGRSVRASATIGSVEMRPRNAPRAVVPVGVLGRAGVRTEVFIGSGERKGLVLGRPLHPPELLAKLRVKPRPSA
jgi:hypothetical protein